MPCFNRLLEILTTFLHRYGDQSTPVGPKVDKLPNSDSTGSDNFRSMVRHCYYYCYRLLFILINKSIYE